MAISKRVFLLPSVLAVLSLASAPGCASPRLGPVPSAAVPADLEAPGMIVPLTVECAPFARALSGLQLRGAAADWWGKAYGRYEQSQEPAVGSVLVFRRGGRLAYGHVAVVSRVLSERQILVTHANWVRHRLTTDQPVIDVSPGNDWSQVRVWWPPSGQIGSTTYPAYGFLLPDRAVSYEDVASATPLAVQQVISQR